MSKLIELLPTMNSKIKENAAWCSSFDLAWKELVDRYLGGKDFTYPLDNETIKNLIEELDSDFTINDKDYYINSGCQTLKLKKEIEKKLKKKFNTISDILDSLEFTKHSEKILIYAIIMFELKFVPGFSKFKDKLLFKNDLVDCFGIDYNSGDNKDLLDNVSVLFYNNENEFAIKLHTDSDKELILHKTLNKSNFKDDYNFIKDTYNKDDKVYKIMNLRIPNLNIDLSNEYQELLGIKLTGKKDNQEFVIDHALQTLKLKLNNEGVKVKSEAAISMMKTAYRPKNLQEVDLNFDNTFYLYIVEKQTPIVALRINDINLFK